MLSISVLNNSTSKLFINNKCCQSVSLTTPPPLTIINKWKEKTKDKKLLIFNYELYE